MAVSLTCQQTIWMSYVLDLKYCINQAAIRLALKEIVYRRSKHISVHYHFLGEKVVRKDNQICPL